MTGLEYETPGAAEREQQLEIAAHAFAMKPEDLGVSLAWAGYDNLRIVRRGAVVLACLTRVPMGQWFGGASVPMAGIAGVAVRPDAARTGVATFLMQRAIEELAADGVALSTLYASTQSLYRKLGYEAAGSRFVATLAPSEIALDQRGGSLRTPTEADWPAIEAFYAEHVRPRDGHLDRGRYIWNRARMPRFGAQTYGMLVEDEGALQGYVFYRKIVSEPPWPTIHVTDMQAASARGYARLWTHLRDLSTAVVRRISFATSPADPAYLVHPDPHFDVRLTENWMLRLVDVPAALRARGYPRGVRAELSFDVQDDRLAGNAGRFVLRVGDGRGDVEPGGPGTLRIDVRGLASMYAGFCAPALLASLGRAQAEPGVLATAATVFAGPAPWMPDMF